MTSSLPFVAKPIIRFEEAELVHENPFHIITKNTGLFHGFKKDYFVVDFGPRAGVVAVKEDKILLTAQYRFLIDAVTWELPGGRVDEGEDSITAAHRECIEETGYACNLLHPLITYRPGLDNVENLIDTCCYPGISIDFFFVYVQNPSAVTPGVLDIQSAEKATDTLVLKFVVKCLMHNMVHCKG